MPTHRTSACLTLMLCALAGCDQGEDPADLTLGTFRTRPDLGVEAVVTPPIGGAGGAIGGAGGGMTNPEGCPAVIDFAGQINGPGAEPPNGGTPAFTPWPDGDTGIAAVKAAFPAEETSVPVDLQITEAVVSATSFFGSGGLPASQTRFWLEDANGAVEFFLDQNEPDSVPPFDMQVGNVVSVKVTEVNLFRGKGQITKAAEWELVNVDQPVHVFEPDRALTVDDVDRVVRVTGILEGEPVGCGGSSRCWNTFNYGAGVGIFRSSSDFLTAGQCVTYVGPVRAFNTDIQFDTINFDWHTNHVEQ
ncbi:MAG: hypothetical protein ACE366_13200 [Bradymonadia bacterium]